MEQRGEGEAGWGADDSLVRVDIIEWVAAVKPLWTIITATGLGGVYTSFLITELPKQSGADKCTFGEGGL